MINPFDPLVAYLETRTVLLDRVDGRIVVSTQLPIGYHVNTGPLILLRSRGGDVSYDQQIGDPSIQCECYAATDLEAMDVAVLLHNTLIPARTRFIARVDPEVIFQQVRDPQTEWPRVVSFYRIAIRS